MRIFISLFVLVSFVAASAQEHEHATAERLGTVHFETSCTPAAQVEFDHAVALLHSFQFGRAKDSLQGVLKSDPDCAMAYWAMALADWSNPFAPGGKSDAQLAPGRKDVERGLAANPQGASRTTSQRERDYLLALGRLYADQESLGKLNRMQAYSDAMEKVAAKYPQDSEAQIFYALALAQSDPLEDKTHAGRLKAGAILEKLFAQEPDHPGLAHYIIHAYDTPDLAAKAVDAARKYGKIAPDAPHALHMPSHTFTRVGYWQESIDANIAAAQAAEREHQYSEELHSMDYRVYAYLQTGQDEAARKLMEDVPAVIGRMNTANGLASAAPPTAGFFAIAAIPARYALERQDWSAAAAIVPAKSPTPYADAISWFARGMGAARLKDTAKAQASVDELNRIVEGLRTSHEDYWATQVEIQKVEVTAWAAMAEKKNDEALKLMNDAARMEDGTDKSAVTPGPLAPAHELLGEMLLQTGKPKPALEQFEITMKKEPNRFRALADGIQAAKLTGDKAKALSYERQLAKVCERGDKPGRKELADARAQ